VGFETMNAPCDPVMFECLVKLKPCCLYLHASPPCFKRLNAAANKAVNLFFNIDERLFHVAKV
jgi:hypothetical protein